MKYGIVFSIIAIFLAYQIYLEQGIYLILIWPAFSFLIVAFGYFKLGPKIFGKSELGYLSKTSTIALFPFLILVWLFWYCLLVVKREKPFHEIAENLFIGRRLRAHELPNEIDHVIDLTSEFNATNFQRKINYLSFQMMDGTATNVKRLESWLNKAAELQGVVYIHCAQGHGRTGLFTALLLFRIGRFDSPLDALEYIQTKRPLVNLSSAQKKLLLNFNND